MDRAASKGDGTWFSNEEDDGVADALGVLNVDWTSENVGVLALSPGDGVDENDRALVEDCG